MKNCFNFIKKYWKAFFCVLWFAFVMSCFFVWGYIQVSAASDQDYFPIEQNKNGYFNSDKISGIANYFDDTNYYIICYYQNYNYFLVRYPKSEKDAGMLCGEKSNNLINWNLYKIGSINLQFYQFQWSDYGEGVINVNYYGTNAFGYWANLPSSNYNNCWDYISNFIVFTNNTSSKQIVILYEEEPEYTDPDNDTYPNNFEKPNIDDYIPTNPPTFDNTDTMSALKSIYDYFLWFGDLIKGLFNYVVDTLNWGLQKVINNIRNVIYDAVQSINGFLSDIKDFASDIKDGITDLVDFVTNPWDSSEFQTQLNNSTFYSSLSSTITNIRTFGTSLTQAAEPESFVITINLTSIGWGTSEIDFNWLIGIRNVVRLIIGCVLIYWLAITVLTSINNIIGSGGDNEE